jgi:hypothetical protein
MALQTPASQEAALPNSYKTRVVGRLFFWVEFNEKQDKNSVASELIMRIYGVKTGLRKSKYNEKINVKRKDVKIWEVRLYLM